MNARWAVRLPPGGDASAALLRLEPGIEIREHEDGLWLRGSDCDERLEARLRMLPGGVRYEVLPDGQLRPRGKRLPHGRLPAGLWHALKSWAQVELPVAKLAGQSVSRIPIGLERTANVAEADCVVTTGEQWLAWGRSAPQVRLERLTFAASSDGRVVLRGKPLPAVAGQRFYERSGLAVPCGWGWPDWLDAALVREALDLPEGDLALFSHEGTWELIPGDQFVARRAARFGFRLSRAEMDASDRAAFNDVFAARQYLDPAADSFWEWRDGGEVITWRNGATIAFRREIVEVLGRLAPHGLPWFDAVVMFFAACLAQGTMSDPELLLTAIFATELQSRAQGKISEPELAKYGIGERPASANYQTQRAYVDLIRAVEALAAVPFALRDTRERKADLAEMVFEAASPSVSPATSAAIVRGIGLAQEMYLARDSQPGVDLLSRLAELVAGADRISPERLALRQKTGLELLPETATIDIPPHESLREFLGRLENDNELGGFARLTKNLLATLTLPRPVSDSHDLPLGGVSDITNRGSLDRLLLSELAQDDLTFTVRVALGEALYLRREAPPHVPPQRRVVLIDCGLRMWGLPRVFATAAAMALAVPQVKNGETLVYRPHGPHLDVVDLATREGLMSQLAALEPEAGPADALAVFQRVAFDDGISSEAVLITCDEVLADKEFHRSLMACEFALLYIVAVTREGRLRLTRRTPQGTKLIREIHCELDEILAPRPAITPLIDPSRDPSLPAILRTDPFPLRLPHPVDPKRLWGVVASGVVCLTHDRRLMHWDKHGRGRRQLLDTLPAGRLLWVDSSVTTWPVRMAVIGRLPQGELFLLHVALDLEKCRVTRLPLLHSNPYGVAAHAGALFVLFHAHVEVFSEEGQWLESRSLRTGMVWMHGRFFNSPEGIYALSFNGMNAEFELVWDSSRWGPGLVGVFDMVGVDGPVAIAAHGTIRLLDDQNAAGAKTRRPWRASSPPVIAGGPTEPGAGAAELPYFPRTLKGGPFRLAAVSADGQRIILTPRAGPVGKQPSWRLDLHNRTTHPAQGAPAIALASDLLKTISNRAIRHRFASISVDEAARITLHASTGRSLCRIERDSTRRQLCLVTRPAAAAGKHLDFVASPPPPGTGYRLSVATWNDGSRAYLDSRGLLHLKSSDLAVPELTLVLTEGTMAGWCADRGLFGPAYFTGTESGNDAAAIFELLCRFVDRLL